MGGSIAVTARKTNGEVIRMCRWTNPLPEFFQNVRWLDSDETHLNEYNKIWFEMREDYKRNAPGPEPDINEDEKAWDTWSNGFEHNMTPVYAPYPFLAPHAYGLVVIDYQTKTLLSMQGYSGLIEILSSWLADVGARLELTEDPHEDELRLQKLFERGCVCVVPWSARDLENARKVSSLEKARKLCANGGWKKHRFFMDPSPWTMTRFPETREGLRDFRERLEQLGFCLTDEEQALWDDYERERWGA